MGRSVSATILRLLSLAIFSVWVASPASSQSGAPPRFWPVAKIPGAIPKVGDIIALRHDETGCMINSAQIDHCYVTKLNGVDYQVAYRPAPNRLPSIDVQIVTNVRTVDPRFRSPEGLKVGDIITIRERAGLILAPYFEVYANRGKNWIPIVGILDKVFVEGADGKETLVPVDQLRFDRNEIHVRIDGFIQRPAVD